MEDIDIQAELSRLADILYDIRKLQTDVNWHVRLDAITEAQRLIEESQGDIPEFDRIFFNFLSPLQTQLSDVRATIVQAATTCIISAAKILKERFEFCAERLSETLVDLLRSSNCQIADYAHQCFLQIIENVHTWRLIPKLVQQFDSRNSNARIKCTFYFQFIFENYKHDIIQRGINKRKSLREIIESGIAKIVSDSQAEARASGRKCFIVYQQMYPQQAASLYQNLDFHAQKAIAQQSGMPAPSFPQQSNSPKPEPKNYKFSQLRQNRSLVRAKSLSKGSNPQVSKATFSKAKKLITELERDHEARYKKRGMSLKAMGSQFNSQVIFLQFDQVSSVQYIKLVQYRKMIRSDLEREFETIGTTLQDTSKIQIERDWQQRLNALRRVQALLQEGIVDHPNFNRIFLNFISPLSIQLQDLRSAIVKEAVATTQMAAEIAQTSFEACAEKLSETLFKLLNSGTKILAEYGNECFLSILENVPTWRLIPKIIEQFSSKNTNIRIKSAQYLQFILENYPIQVIQEGISQRSKLTEMIERGIKRIVSDAANDARAAGRRCFQGYQVMFPDRGGALFHQLDTSVQRALSGELGGVPAMPSPSKQSLKVPPANNKRSTSARMSRQNVPAQPVEQPKPQKQNSQKLNKSVPKNLYNERDATPTEVVRDPSGTGGSDILERPRRPPSREIEQKQQAAFQRPAPVPEPPKRQLSQEKPSVQGQLDITLEKFYNDNWAIRFNASERITTFLNSDEVIELLSTNNSLWDSMMQAHLEHMNDQHFKVSVSCLSNLKTITELFPEKVSFALENIMPRLLVCLADSKEILSSSATGLLETILDIYMPEDLIVLLLRWNPTENKPKIKVKLLELFGQLVNQIPDYFDTVGNVKLYLRKVAQLLKDTQTSRPVIAAASNSIQVARAKNLTCMMSALAELSEEEQSILKTLAQDSGIPLEAQRQNIRKSNSQPTQPKSAGMQLVEGLLRQLRGSGAVRYDALKKIQALNESYEANYVIWEESFQQILTSLLECLNDESLAIRDLVLQILKSIFETQQANGQQNIEQTLNALTQALYWEERQMMQSTEETMMQILERLDPGRAISLILKIVPEVRVPAIQALIRHMTKVVQRSSPAALNPLVRDLVDQLKVQFNHSNADVRKSVVFCFVEVFLVMGNEFNAYLEELSPSQQKLVAIYIQRRHDSTNFQYQDLQVNGIGDTYRSIPQE